MAKIALGSVFTEKPRFVPDQFTEATSRYAEWQENMNRLITELRELMYAQEAPKLSMSDKIMYSIFCSLAGTEPETPFTAGLENKENNDDTPKAHSVYLDLVSTENATGISMHAARSQDRSPLGKLKTSVKEQDKRLGHLITNSMDRQYRDQLVSLHSQANTPPSTSTILNKLCEVICGSKYERRINQEARWKEFVADPSDIENTLTKIQVMKANAKTVNFTITHSEIRDKSTHDS